MSTRPPTAACADNYDAGDAAHEAMLEGLTKADAAALVHGLMAAGLDPADPTWQTPLVQAPHPNEATDG